MKRSAFDPPSDPVDRTEFVAWGMKVVLDDSRKRCEQEPQQVRESMERLFAADEADIGALHETVRLARLYRERRFDVGQK